MLVRTDTFRSLARFLALCFVFQLTRFDNNDTGLQRRVSYSVKWEGRLRGGSSAFCSGDSVATRVCRFENLCYVSEHDEFLLLHGTRSLFSGLPSAREALVDMSSVSDHNTQRFEFVDLPVAALFDGNSLRQPITYRHGFYVLFKRFNPGNLMHVIHDDLLPIYLARLKHQTTENESLQLVAVDNHPQSPYKELYEAVARNSVILKAELAESRVTCFESALVGLPKDTTWYQYGFSKPQGPINTQVDSKLIRLFAVSLEKALGINVDNQKEYRSGVMKNVVMLSRSVNRVILNEYQLAKSVEMKFNCRVDIVSVEATSVSDLIRHVSQADVLIGMHGGPMALATFLTPSSAIVELFPYAVPADAYTPYKTLAGLPGMNIGYGAWENKWKENTVTHPEYPAAFGGISHLAVSEQEQIMTSSVVGKHFCCSNPEWLFRIYQDTHVDIPSVMELISTTWHKAQLFN